VYVASPPTASPETKSVSRMLAMFSAKTPAVAYRGTSLIRNNAPLGPYSRTMPRALWWS